MNMPRFSSSWTPHEVLWELGAKFIDASAESADEVLTSAMEVVAELLEADAVAIWSVDPHTMVSRVRHNWSRKPSNSLGSLAEVTTNKDVSDAVMAGGGIAILPIADVVGESLAQERGWTSGLSMLAIIHEGEPEVDVISVSAGEPDWGERERALLQGVVLMIRQFQRRARTESRLAKRHRLDSFTVELASRLQSATAADINEMVTATLADLRGVVGAESVVLIDILDDRTISLPHVIAESALPSEWRTLELPDVSMLPGAENPGLRDYASSVRIIDLVDMLEATVGSDAAEAFGISENAVELALLPASVPPGDAVLALSRQGSDVWPADELDALSALASLVAQARGRVGAEHTINIRLRRDEQLAAIADLFLGSSVATADEAIEASLPLVGDIVPGLVGIVLNSVGPTQSRVEAVWTDFEGPAPRVGDVEVSNRDGGPLTVEAFTALAQSPEWPARVAARLPDDVLFTHLPLFAGDTVEAVLGFLTTSPPTDLDLETYRQFASMLGPFRSRLAGERTLQRTLEAQQVLSRCAAALAEAEPDEMDDAFSSVMEWVADYCDTGGVTDWVVDHRNGRYVLRNYWLRAAGDLDHIDHEPEWGARPLLDSIRLSGVSEAVVPTRPTADDPNRIAVPRGAGRVDRIFVVMSLDSTPWSTEVIEMLESLSRLMHEVETRVAAQRYSQAAFEDAPIGVVLRDNELNLITCNQAFVDFVGASSVEELVGTPPDHVYDDDFEDVSWNDERQGTISGVGAFRGPGGARVWGQMRASVVDGVGPDPLWLVHIEDVTERRRVEQLLRFQATHDELTGLANRRRLLDEIRRIADGNESVAVLLIDIDRFKNINDSLGHDRGDELLVVIADRLRLAVRPGDLVARLGGDEFSVVLPGPVTVPEAEMVAERLMRLIGEPVTVGRQNLYPTASVGIAVADDVAEVDDLLRRADTAMYRAKAQGRARAESFGEELREAVTTRMATESGLRHALRNNELIVHYQPEVSLTDGSMLGAEALVRWIHPEKGLLSAAAFIEVAEESGVVTEIGDFVLAEACREAASWPGGDDGPMIRVNLAAAQLQREETVTLVRSALAETGLVPSRLCLEITESAVMNDVARSEEILRRLKNLGVELAVDDFGTGFSSLAYLKRFPVDALKIDRTFVKDLGHDSEDEAFVRSIVSLADALGLSVVAEGVETALQQEMLVELGCDRAQGYLFARPGPPEDLQSRLREYARRHDS